ncbi:MAG TPA: glycosyltransferase family 1 protein [Candidatus Saccharimonadales bacterium]|nr:glycosyltransferase family 1 protein [Candidatus Saccharimonadales bacterium]
MRIGIDCRLWNESGVGRYIRNLVRELGVIDKKNYYTLFVLSSDYDEVASHISNKKNWTLVKADIRWHTIWEQITFPALIASEELDLVHFPYFSVPIFYHKKFIVTIHDLILHHYPTGKASTLPPPLYWLKQFGYKFIIQEASRKSNFIITVSNATKAEIIKHFDVDPDRVTVTYEGVDKKISNSGQGTDVKNPYFLYVGNAYPHKNLERLLEAFLQFHHHYPTVKLQLVGRQDYFYKRIKKLIHTMSLENSVSFMGYVSDEKLAELYKNCLAVVCPSLMEGFGLPGLEAMEYGALVLASNIVVYKEIYKQNCLYFDPFKVKDIEKRLVDAYHVSQKKREEYGRKESVYVKSFAWQQMAKKTLKIYQEVYAQG